MFFHFDERVEIDDPNGERSDAHLNGVPHQILVSSPAGDRPEKIERSVDSHEQLMSSGFEVRSIGPQPPLALSSGECVELLEGGEETVDVRRGP
jgi:hypothetical protein